MFRTVLRCLCILFLALPLFAQAPAGSLTAWGDNATKTTVALATSVERIDAGQVNTIAIATDQVTVFTWSGLGNATNASTTPTAVLFPVDPYIQCITQVAAGDGHFLALANAADLYAWGSNAHGQLGNGTTAGSAAPVRVVFPPAVVSITQIAAGAQHSLAFTNDGVYAWGDNTNGSVGDGTTQDALVPVKVALPASVTWVSGLGAGFKDSFAITNDGLYAWGYNFFGQLGDGTTADKLTPVLLSFPRRPAFTAMYAVAAGRYHTLVLTDSGVFAFGQNINGTLGDGTLDNSSVPIAVKFPKTVSAVSAIAAGTFHSLAVTNDGLYAWGTDVAGQLGTVIAKKKITPTKVTGEDNALQAGAGEYFSVVLHH